MRRCRFVVDDGGRQQKNRTYRRVTDEVKLADITWASSGSMPGIGGASLSLFWSMKLRRSCEWHRGIFQMLKLMIVLPEAGTKRWAEALR